MADKEFKVGIILDASGVVKGVEDATGAFTEFNKGLEESQGELAGTEKAAEAMASGQETVTRGINQSLIAITALNSALELGKKAWGAISGAIESTTAAFSVQETAEAGVSNALKLTNQFTEGGFQGWKDWAAALQNVTTTGDEATLGLVKTATALGLSEEKTKTLIKASIDLSAVTGKSVQGSFRLLQGTYAGVATSLEKLGIDTDGLTVEQIKSGAAVDLVADKFRGMAEAQTKTFTGASIQSANAYGDVLEEIGKLFVDVLDLTGSSKTMTQFWVDVGAAIGDVRRFVVQVKIATTEFLDLPWSKLSTAALIFGGLTVAIVAVQIATGTANANMVAFILNIVRSGQAALTAGAQYAVLALKAGLIAAGVATVILAIDLLVRNLKNLPALADLVWNVFKKAFTNMAAVIGTMIGEMAGSLADLAKGAGMTGLGEALGKAAQSASNKAIANFDIATGLQKKIDDLATQVDTGFAGDIAKKISEALNPDLSASGPQGGSTLKETGGGGGGGGAAAAAAVAAVAAAKENVKEKEKEKVVVEKITEAQKNLNALINSQTGLQTNINEFGKTNSELLAMRLSDRLKEIDAIAVAAGAQDSLAVAQAKSNEIKLANLKFAEMEKGVIDDLKDDVADLNLNSLEGVDLAKEKLRIDLENLNLKEDELAKAGLLSLEAERLLDAKRKAMEISGQKDIKKAESDQAHKGDEPGSAAPSVSFINEAQLATIQSSFGATTAATVGGIAGAASAFAGPVAAAGAILSMASGIIDAVLDIPKKLAEVFNKLTDFGPNFAKAIQDLLKSIVGMVSSLIPNLLQGLFDIIMSVLDMFATSLPDAFMELANKIPEMLQKFVDAAPEMAQKLIQGLFKMNPTTLVTKFMVSIIKSLPKLITSLVDSIPLIINEFITGFMDGIDEMVAMFVDLFINGGVEKIIKAVIVALAEGVKKIFKGIFGGFKLPSLPDMPEIKVPKELTDLPDKMGNAVKDAAQGIKAGGSDVFAVLDVAKVKSAKSIDKSIGEATKRAAKVFKAGFQDIENRLLSVWNKLREAWLWIYNTILLPIINAIKVVWLFIYDNIIKPLLDGIQAVWDFFVEKILEPLLEGIQAVWDFFVDKIMTPLLAGIQAVWDFFVEKILEPFSSGIQAVWDFFKENILDKFSSGIKAVFDWFKENILDKFSSGFQAAIDSLSSTVSQIPGKIGEGVTNFANTISSIPGKIGEGVTNFANTISSIPGKIGEGVSNLWGAINAIPGKLSEGATNLFNKFGEIGTKVFDQIKDAFDRLNPANMLAKMFDFDGGGKGTLENLLNVDFPVRAFAEGGIVPGRATVAGDHIKNDTIAAFLSPDEAVIPRSIMAQPEMRRIVESILDGTIQFRHKKKQNGVSIPHSHASVSVPKLPSVSDLQSLSTADLANAIETNLNALKNLAFGDLWNLIKDKVIGEVKTTVFGMIKSAGSFETGGIVPNDGVGMLHKSEVVLPTALIDRITGNNQSSSPSPSNITLNANITVQGGEQGQGAGKKIVDEMFAEIRKRSANQKIMFESGLIR